jgi:type II secretory pathway pseudopilin PulG
VVLPRPGDRSEFVIRVLGQSLVELLVVIAIIAILGSLALLAVAASRSTSRDLVCRNNLRQIGLATIRHFESKKSSPFFGPGAHGLGSLLPYLGETALYESLGNFSEAYEKFDRPPSVFKCPSDALSFEYPSSNYIPCGGKTSYALKAHEVGIGAPGVTRLGQISDGLSNTMLFSERLVAPKRVSGFEESVKRGSIRVNEFVETEEAFHESCFRTYQRKNLDDVNLSGYGASLFVFYTFGTTYPPNHPSCIAMDGVLPPELGFDGDIAANSLHPGWVNIVRGDASVVGAGNDISIEVWQSMATIAGDRNPF